MRFYKNFTTVKSTIIFAQCFLLLLEVTAKMFLEPEIILKSTISECIEHIVNKHFKNSKKISIKYSNQQTSISKSQIIKIIDSPIFINAEEISHTEEIDKRIPDDVILIINETINISKILTESKWTSTTQFLMIIGKASEKSMVNIFKEFWAKNIVNVLLLLSDESYVHIYTFTPYNQYNCAVQKLELLATWTSGRIITKKIIQKERVSNLNGCTLNASVVDKPPSIWFPNEESRKGTNFINGIEGLILAEISTRLNFKLNYAEPKDGKDWGDFHPSPNGVVGEVFLKKSHFACGRFAYKPDRFKYLDMSVPISCDIECMSWAVPVGAKKAQAEWKILLITGLSNNVWYSILATIIFTAALFRILAKYSPIDQHLFSGNIKTIFYTFESSLGASVKVPRSSPLKILFCTWIWYCLVIVTAYQALMGSKLTVPYKQPNINTFKDLLESKLHITGFRGMFTVAIDSQEEDEDIKALGNRFTNAQFGFDQAIEKLVRDKNIAYMGTLTTFMYGVLLDPKAKGLIHFMKECVHKYYPVIFLQKNSPFTNTADRIIRSLFEAGIICKWRRQYVYDVPQPGPEVEKLTLERMISPFVILGVGLGVAVLVFMAELVAYWYSSRKILKNGDKTSHSRRPQAWQKIKGI